MEWVTRVARVLSALDPTGLAYLWRTRLTVLHDEDVDLGLEVARAAAWQTGGEVAERHS